jgi:nitrilase
MPDPEAAQQLSCTRLNRIPVQLEHYDIGIHSQTMASANIRLAPASPGTRGTTKETLAQLDQLASSAAANKADLLLLPEAYLGGYPRGSDFGCKVGARTAEGRDEFLEYFKNAIDLGDTVGNGAGAGDAWIKRQLGNTTPGRSTNTTNGVKNYGGAYSASVIRGDGTREEVERIARETGVFIVVGLVEKAGGSLYCSVIYVCPKLGTIGKRRKVQPVSKNDSFSCFSRILFKSRSRVDYLSPILV